MTGVAKKPRWDYHLEWFDLYPLASTVFGVAWRGEPEGQGTYREVEVSADGSEWNSIEDISAGIAEWLARECPETEQWRIDLWWERESEPPPTDSVMAYLCHHGHLPAGKYLVTTWW